MIFILFTLECSPPSVSFIYFVGDIFQFRTCFLQFLPQLMKHYYSKSGCLTVSTSLVWTAKQEVYNTGWSMLLGSVLTLNIFLLVSLRETRLLYIRLVAIRITLIDVLQFVCESLVAHFIESNAEHTY